MTIAFILNGEDVTVEAGFGDATAERPSAGSSSAPWQRAGSGLWGRYSGAPASGFLIRSVAARRKRALGMIPRSGCEARWRARGEKEE